MKHVAYFLTGLGLSFCAAGCRDTVDAWVKDSLELHDRIADTLEGIKTKEDAEAARDQLALYQRETEKLQDRFQKILNRRGKDRTRPELDKIEEEIKATIRKYDEQGRKADQRIQEALRKMAPALRTIVEKEFPRIGAR